MYLKEKTYEIVWGAKVVDKNNATRHETSRNSSVQRRGRCIIFKKPTKKMTNPLLCNIYYL